MNAVSPLNAYFALIVTFARKYQPDAGVGTVVALMLPYVVVVFVLWTLLLLEPMKEACEGVRDRAAAAAEFLEPLIERLAISRRYADGMRRILAVLPRLATGRAGRFARTEMFQLAVEVAAAELASRGESTEAMDRLRAPAPPPPVRRERHHDLNRRRR